MMTRQIFIALTIGTFIGYIYRQGDNAGGGFKAVDEFTPSEAARLSAQMVYVKKMIAK